MADEAKETVEKTEEVEEITNIENTDEAVEVEEKPVETGLTRMMNRYKSEESEEADEKPEKPEESSEKYDYEHFKDINEEDYQKLDKQLEDWGQKENAGLRYHLAMRENDVKKQQRLAEERKKTIEELEKAKPDGKVEKYEQFLKDLKEDFTSAIDRYKDEFDLPDSNYIVNQLKTGGDVTAELQQWQDNKLVPEVEKRFKLEEDEFVYDPADAHRAGTPSYEYRVQTERKEKELIDRYNTVKKKDEEALTKILEERERSVKNLWKNYFEPKKSEKMEEEEYKKIADEADGNFKEMLTGIETMWQKLQEEGDYSPQSNPFSMYNIFRGVHFDKLVDKAVEAERKKIHAQYSKHGLYLPDKEPPKDVTTVKGKPEAVSEIKGNKPLDRFRKRVLSTGQGIS